MIAVVSSFQQEPLESTPMPVSMYQASVPLLLRGLNILTSLLTKIEAHPDSTMLVDARLAPDMMTLVGQVQRASDTAKGCAARLAGVEPPSFADTEKSLTDLRLRIAKTVEFLQSFKPEQIDGSESKPITFKGGPNTFNFIGQNYLFTFVLPNFFFHITTAYAILRHNGVTLGKMDYLGEL
jgi:hypothetical protein